MNKEEKYYKLINKIYNLIATNTTFETRTDIEKEIINLINKIYLEER